jgi:hypothetical protein
MSKCTNGRTDGGVDRLADELTNGFMEIKKGRKRDNRVMKRKRDRTTGDKNEGKEAEKAA